MSSTILLATFFMKSGPPLIFSLGMEGLINFGNMSDAQLDAFHAAVQTEKNRRSGSQPLFLAVAKSAAPLPFKPLPKTSRTLRTFKVDRSAHWEDSREDIFSVLGGQKVMFVNVNGRKGAALINFASEKDTKQAHTLLAAAGYDDVHCYTGALGTDVAWWEN